jgi:hypothetical protein
MFSLAVHTVAGLPARSVRAGERRHAMINKSLA